VNSRPLLKEFPLEVCNGGSVITLYHMKYGKENEKNRKENEP